MSTLYTGVPFASLSIEPSAPDGPGRGTSVRAVTVGAVIGFVAMATVLVAFSGTDAIPIVSRSAPAADIPGSAHAGAPHANAAVPTELPRGYAEIETAGSWRVRDHSGPVEVLSSHDAAGALTGVVTSAQGFPASVLQGTLHPGVDPSVTTLDLGGIEAAYSASSKVWAGVSIIAWNDAAGTTHAVTGWGVDADQLVKLAAEVASGAAVPGLDGFSPVYSGVLGSGPMGYAVVGSTITESAYGAPGNFGRSMGIIETDGQLPIDVYGALTPSSPAPAAGPPSALVSSRPQVLEGQPVILETVMWQAGKRTITVSTYGSSAAEALAIASAVR